MKLLICIVGGSGSGKSVLENNLCIKDGFKKAISHTTRPKREGEVNGREYHFVDNEEFNKLDLLESVEFVGNKYGLSSSEFDKSNGDDLVFVVKPNGLKQIRDHIEKNKLDIIPITIYMNIPYKERFKNMVKRGDSPIKIQERLTAESIVEEFENSNIKPEIEVKVLNDKTAEIVMKDIEDIKKILRD